MKEWMKEIYNMCEELDYEDLNRLISELEDLAEITGAKEDAEQAREDRQAEREYQREVRGYYL